MLKYVMPLLGSLGGGSILGYGVIAAGAVGVGGVIYNHGKTVERGKHARVVLELVEDRDKVADNFVTLAVNMQRSHFEELRRVSARSLEIVNATEGWFTASDRARETARAQLNKYRSELVELERESETFQRQLKEANDAWLQQKTPFDLVCSVYDGVLDIDDCTRLRDTRAGGANTDSE